MLTTLSEARRELTEGHESGEWATSALFMRGPSRPLYDVAQGVDTGVAPPRPVLLDPAVIVRATGDFVGRRTEIRTLLRALRGGSPGVLIQGLGGVGKTVLAAELVSLLGAEAGLVVSTAGRTSPDQILAETAGRLLAATAREGDEAAPLRNLAVFIREPANDVGGSWRVRFSALADLIGESPVTLLLDNFEDNLVSATDHSFLDEELAAFMAAWTSVRGRLIVTCRYPVDIPGGELHTLHLGPLLLAEARKLMWRLPGLDALSIEDRRRAWTNVGGHPRTLEYVDALLRSGRANFRDITRRMEGLLSRRPEVGDPRTWLNTAGPSLDAAMAEAITLAVVDTLLGDLVASLDPLAQIVLVGASVFRLPCTRAGLAWLCSPPEEERDTIVAHYSGLLEELRGERPDAELEDLGLPPDEIEEVRAMMAGAINLPQGPAELDQAIQSLVDLSLVVRIDTDEPSQPFYLAHRWTASTLQQLLADGDSTDLVRRAHLAATGYWWAVGRYEPIRKVTWLEMRHHLHAAGDLDGALSVTGDLTTHLRHEGAHALAGSLLMETLGWFPAPDLRRAEILDELSMNAEDLDDVTRARDYCDESREIHERENNREGLLVNFHRLARLSRRHGDNEEAARWNDRSSELAENLDDRHMLANTYHESSLLAEHRASFEEALTWAQRALDLRLAIDDRRGAGASYHLLGVITHQQGELDTAHGWFQKALDVALTSGYRGDEAVAYHELGLIALEQGDLDSAVTWTRKGVVLNEQIGGKANLSAGYYQLGTIAFQREEPEEALHWFTRSLGLSDLAGDRMGSADTRRALGVLAEARGALDEAYNLFTQAHATYEALGHAPRAARTAADLARVEPG